MRSLVRRSALIIVVFVAAYGLFMSIQQESQKPNGVIDGLELQSYLIQQYRERDPHSAEGRRLAALIRKARKKMARRFPAAENPGALIEALAEIKTAADGSVYPPNYRARELHKAHIRQARRTSLAADPIPWVERGPGNVSGRVRAIVVDPDDATRNTWYIASIGGGVWKTTNGGSQWTHLTPQLTSLSTTTLAMAASNHDVMYVGTGMGYGRVVELEGAGIWKTTDRGVTWTQLESTANGQILAAVNRIVVDPDDENILLACTNDSFSHMGTKGGTRVSGIFRSSDGGATWTQVFDPEAIFGAATDNRVQQIIANPEDFSVLYASVNEVGVIKSTDGGLTWVISADNFALPSDIGNPTGAGFGLAGISVRTELAIAPSDPNRIYAAVERPRGIGDLYMSTDAGASWTLVEDTGADPNWFNSNGASGASGAYTAGWFDNAIAVHPYDENTVIVGGVNLYQMQIDPQAGTRSTTPLAWWIPNPQNIPVVHADHHWLELVPINEAQGTFRILNGNDGGVALSDDAGATWLQITGMGTTQFYGVDKKPGEDIYIGGTQDNGSWISSVNPGAASPWRFILGGDGFEAAWNYRDPNLVLGTSQGGSVSRSTDGGVTWQPIPSATAGGGPFISKVANSKADPDLVFAVGTAGINRSDDFGASWTLTPFAANWLGYRPFDNVEASNADAQIVWATSRFTIDPPAGRRGGLHVSTDGGLSFTERTDRLPFGVTESSGLGTDPVDPSTAYLLFSAPRSAKVLKTTDLGASWTEISGFAGNDVSSNGFPDVACFTLLVMPFNTDILWVGTEIGIFISENGGQTWEAGEGLPHVAVFELSIVDDQVLAATQGRGIWTATLPELEGYTPPTPTLAPRLNKLALLPTGDVELSLDRRSAYDSTVVFINGQRFNRLDDNAAPDNTIVLVPVTQETTVSASVVSYRDGRELKSALRSVQAFPTFPQTAYSNPAEDATDAADLIGVGFNILTPAGFSSQAIHSPHPYGNQANYILRIKTPIIVASSDAIMQFDEVVLVEEGIDVFPSVDFFDFAIVEGTKDGCNWQPLTPGYDSRDQAIWSQAYQSGIDQNGDSQTAGDESMYVNRSIDLLETFAPGDTIFIRFRLFADPLSNAWGWAIDNIKIQIPAVGVTERHNADLGFDLRPNVPNPFFASTEIPYTLHKPGPVVLSLFDVSGRLVRELYRGFRPAGEYAYVWNGTDAWGRRAGSGLYIVRLDVDGASLTRSIALLRQ